MKYSILSKLKVFGLFGLVFSPCLQAAMISGTVVGSDGGSPIAEGKVELYNLAGSRLDRVDLDGSGGYAFIDLTDGDYLLYFNADGAFANYVDEIHNDVACPGRGCDFTSLGTPVNVSGGDVIVDAQLDPGLSITGTITASDTMLPLEGTQVRVVARNVNNNVAAAFVISAADGSYTLPGLLETEYNLYFQTDSVGPTAQYYAKAYADIPCNVSCSPGLLTPVTPDNPGPLVIDTELDPGVVFTGTITETTNGTPIGAQVRFSGLGDLDGYSALTSSSSLNGEFRSRALAPGDYIAYFGGLGQYVDEYWDDVSCRDGCVAGDATQIVGAAGATVVVDAELEFTSGIIGTLTASDTDLPIFPDGFVSAYDESGVKVGSASVDPAGDYRLGVPPGQYYLHFFTTDAGSPYLDELYDNVPCSIPGCDIISLGTLVNKQSDDLVVDAQLDKGASLSGTVTNEETAQGIPVARVFIYDSAGDLFTIVNTDVVGNYSLAMSLGTYYLKFSQSATGPDYDSEVHDNVPCVLSCDPELVGTAVVIDSTGDFVVDATLARRQVLYVDGFED